ncbi:hypothetical protein N7468_009180 [Penicillium chermesinum]|uniref:Xylanolytic transcriptional activator regulatory domain-containing protein n=1 Tax=Penicillium chermesinum TaxID=63820 RepID=A0A9W9NHC6_9EURO|nr:uncharacterized protein N7468_009180 [Penicillium chermesinum]KAJ5219976.1 hypothetical protein N7468_009180 [Penicillium chermesinum]
MDRLHHLESLVKDLTGKLEQAHAAAKSPPAASPNSPGSSTHDHETAYRPNSSPRPPGVQKQFGRLVIQDSNQSRYVGSGFWSWVNDELGELKTQTGNIAAGDSNTSDDEDESSYRTPSTQELGRSPSERHAFMFRHNLNSAMPDLREFHPLPSQIPFLLEVYAENVNIMARTLHMPTVSKMIRDLRGDMTKLTPANEALLFAIYYAAVTSMEEADVTMNFGSTKAELNLKYRVGLEQALAKADFLSVPDLALVQAFAIFLLLLRRHDSPRFVWMMTGIAIRMAIALGLHRDGSHFPHLTPYEIEIRRRAWYTLIVIDVRASEDQGSDFGIAVGSFDTKLPLNINDADFGPDTKEPIQDVDGLTEMSLPRVTLQTSLISKQMVASSGTISVEEQINYVEEMYRVLESNYLIYFTEPDRDSNVLYWASIAIIRIVMAKMTLLVFLPVLFSKGDHLPDETRDKLLIAAIEVAEYNHALNSSSECRQWRWIFQTYTHWHSIVFILIEVARRQWSPIAERAWAALHSVHLIPPQSHMNKNLRMWLPLRKLKAKAAKHRDAEISRLKSDPQATRQLEIEDRGRLQPSSPGPFPAGSDSTELFFDKWRQLISPPETFRQGLTPCQPFGAPFDPMSGDIQDGTAAPGFETSINPALAGGHTIQAGQMAASALPSDQFDQLTDSDITPWLWSEETFGNPAMESLDINMDLDSSDVDWYNWVESAKTMESDILPKGSGSHG